MWKYVLGALGLVGVGAVVAYVVFVGRVVREPVALEDILPSLPNSPLDATYNIDGKEITLSQGRYEHESAPDSASSDVYMVWGEPITADVNADGEDDLLLWLTYSGGGSGTFYYMAAVVKDGDGYRGSNAVPLGDRITPQHMDVWYDVVRVKYTDHTETQPLAEQTSQDVTRYFMVAGANVVEFGPFAPGAQVLTGTLVWDETRPTFTPCGGVERPVDSTSPASAALKTVYALRTDTYDSPQGVFVVVAGAYTEPVQKEEDVDSAPAIVVDLLLSAPEGKVCEEPASVSIESEAVDDVTGTTTDEGLPAL